MEQVRRASNKRLDYEAERRRRRMLHMSSAEYVCLGWLTGQEYRDRPKRARGPYRKGRARRVSGPAK